MYGRLGIFMLCHLEKHKEDDIVQRQHQLPPDKLIEEEEHRDVVGKVAEHRELDSAPSVLLAGEFCTAHEAHRVQSEESRRV